MRRRNTEPNSASSPRGRLLRDERRDAIRDLRSSSDSLFFPSMMTPEDHAAIADDQLVVTRQQTIARQKLQDIDAALANLESGEYGFCQECNAPIPGKRLNAMPWASCCVRCQEEGSHRGKERSGTPRSRTRENSCKTRRP